MHKIKKMLMDELYEYEDKAKTGGKISTAELEKIHTLTDTVKNIDKIEMLEGKEGYSEYGRNALNNSYGSSYDYDSSYNYGSSYRRNSNRDRMGRYSREGAKEHLINKAEQMLDMAEDEKQKRAIHHFIKTLENE